MNARLTLASFLIVASISLTAAGAAAPPEFDLSSTLNDVVPGDHLFGPEVKISDLQGRVVLVYFWGVNSGPSLREIPELNQMQETYKDQGFVLIGFHMHEVSDDGVRALCEQREIGFTVTKGGEVKGVRTRAVPHGFLFDHTGACVWRGGGRRELPPGPAVKAAMEKAPAGALAGREFVKLQYLADALKAGRPAGSIIIEARRSLDSTNAETAEEAEFIVERLLAWGNEQIKNAKGLRASRPRDCLPELEKVAQNFRGTSVETDARKAIAELRDDPDFARELQAYQILDQIKAQEERLRPLANNDTTSDNFRRRNQAVLNQMLGGIRLLRQRFGDCRATTEAIEIGRKYGLPVDA